MSDWLKDVDNNLLNEQTQKEDSYEPGIAAGVYDVKIELAYITTNKDTGTQFLAFNFETIDDKKIFFNGVVQLLLRDSEDKGSKTYWEKDGKKTQYSGWTNLNRLCTVLKMTMEEIAPEEATIELFGEQVKVKAFKKLVGKQVKIALQKQETLNQNNEVKEKNDVIAWMDKDGKYGDEDILEKMVKRIEKTPTRPLSKKDKAKLDGGSTTSSDKKGKEPEGGW